MVRPSPSRPTSLSEAVRRKARRMAAGRARRESPFRHLLHVGALGWMFVLPVVAGAFAGRALATATGRAAYGVGPLAAGIAIGAYIVWRQVRQSLRDDADQDDDGGAS